MTKKSGDDDKQPILIIKRIKKGGGGHHGGAWKVAYADFVTAMMAFFLLLWLLNVTTDEQKAMISSYFSPADPRVAQSISGSGGVMGGSTMSDVGAMAQNRVPPLATPGPPSAGAGKESGDNSEEPVSEAQKAEMDKVDEKSFAQTKDKLLQMIEQNPELSELAKNLVVDMTPEGLRIQIVDQNGRPMFPLGSAVPLPEAIKLLKAIVTVVTDLPNKISLRGHTDAKPYAPMRTYSNWELSADRANSSRRVMVESKFNIARVENVQGKAEREPLVKDDPLAPQNRRVSIILLKQSIVPGVYTNKNAPAPVPQAPKPVEAPEEPQIKKKEQGIIYFP